jgi:hypothetical protein
MTGKPAMKRSLLIVVAFLSGLVLFWNGCKEHESIVQPQPTGTTPEQVSAAGSVTLPSGSSISLASLKVTVGAFGQTTPNANGTISLSLNKGMTQLVSAISSTGDPVLLSIIPDAQNGSGVTLSSYTTAEAMIFLNPAVVVSDPSLSQQVLGIIRGMPETETLAGVLTTAIASDPRALITENSAISTALTNAINRFVSLIDGLATQANLPPGQKRSIEQYRELKHYRTIDVREFAHKSLRVANLIISPATPQSGVSVAATQVSTNTYSVQVTNTKKRFVGVYLDDSNSGTNIAKALLPSRKSLISFAPLGPSTVDLDRNIDLTINPRSTLRAYALGAINLAGLTSSPSWQARIVSPVLLTGIADFFVPLLEVITGVRNIAKIGNWDNPSGVIGEIISSMTTNAAYTSQLVIAIGLGNYTQAIGNTVVAAAQVIVQNPIYVFRILRDAGFSVLESMASQAVLPLRILFVAGSVFELGAAIYDFSQSSWVVSFSLTSSDSLPTVTTAAITGITTTSASGGGNVTSQGSASVTARGVCWSTSQNPTTADSKTVDGSGTGSFTSSITGLSPATTYYVRAYATNSAGTSYGSQVSFATAATTALPTVTTLAASPITSSGATLNGTVNPNGSSTNAWFEYGTSPTLSSYDSTTSQSVGSGTNAVSFNQPISNLSPSTTYYYRIAASNDAGTNRGSILDFTTSQPSGNLWTRKADFEGTGRFSAIGFSIGKNGYIGTGFNTSSVYSDFWQYDSQTDTWTQKADFAGGSTYRGVSFSIGIKGYVLGAGTKDFWEYDPQKNTWTKKADFRGEERANAIGFSIGNKGYVGTGGRWSVYGSLSDFWEYDPSTDTWTQKADFLGSVQVGGGAVGFSINNKGYMGLGSNGSADFWEYDPSTDSWTRRKDFLGNSRSWAVGFSIGSKGYVGTGWGSNVGPLSDFWEYDPKTDTWTQKADFSGQQRYRAVAFSIGEKGYIGTGSYLTPGDYLLNTKSLKDFWEYDPGQ